MDRDDEPSRAPQHEPEGDDDPTPAAPRRALAHGIFAALAVDTLFNVPSVFLMPLVRPENIAAAVGKLLLGISLLVGYLGGRAAARAGVTHDDARSQWSMAWAVAVLSHMVALLSELGRLALRPSRAVVQHAGAASQGATSMSFFLQFTAVVLLVRFGFAMGTYAQAKREGRVQEEDEAGAD